MRILFASIAIAVSLFIGSSLALETPPKQPAPGLSEKASVCERLKTIGATPEKLATAHCCPGDTECGCQNGRVVCCSGKLSPRCTC